VAGGSFTPGHLSSGAADCARATAVTTTGPPDSSRPLPAQPGERAAIEPQPPAARRHREPCGSHREPASCREGMECASPNAGGKCNKDCRGLRQLSSHKHSTHGVQRTRNMRLQTLAPAPGRSRPAATRSSILTQDATILPNQDTPTATTTADSIVFIDAWGNATGPRAVVTE